MIVIIIKKTNRKRVGTKTMNKMKNIMRVHVERLLAKKVMFISWQGKMKRKWIPDSYFSPQTQHHLYPQWEQSISEQPLIFSNITLQRGHLCTSLMPMPAQASTDSWSHLRPGCSCFLQSLHDIFKHLVHVNIYYLKVITLSQSTVGQKNNILSAATFLLFWNLQYLM